MVEAVIKRLAAAAIVATTIFGLVGCAQFLVVGSSTFDSSKCGTVSTESEAERSACEKSNKALVLHDLKPQAQDQEVYARAAASIVNSWVTYLPWPRNSAATSDVFLTDAVAGMRLKLIVIGSTRGQPDATPTPIGSVDWTYRPAMAPTGYAHLNGWPTTVTPSASDYAFLEIFRALGEVSPDKKSGVEYLAHVEQRLCEAADLNKDCTELKDGATSGNTAAMSANTFQQHVINDAMGFKNVRVHVHDNPGLRQPNRDYELTAEALALRLCKWSALSYRDSRNAQSSPLSVVAEFQDGADGRLISYKLSSAADMFGERAVGADRTSYSLAVQLSNPVRVSQENRVRYVSPCDSISELEQKWSLRVLGVRRSLNYFCRTSGEDVDKSCPLIDPRRKPQSQDVAIDPTSLVRAADQYFTIGFGRGADKFGADRYLRLPPGAKDSLVLASGDVLLVEPTAKNAAGWLPVED